jgi:hypothetical protein
MDARAEQVDLLVKIVGYLPLFLMTGGYLVERDEVVLILVFYLRRLWELMGVEVEERRLIGGYLGGGGCTVVVRETVIDGREGEREELGDLLSGELAEYLLDVESGVWRVRWGQRVIGVVLGLLGLGLWLKGLVLLGVLWGRVWKVY